MTLSNTKAKAPGNQAGAFDILGIRETGRRSRNYNYFDILAEIAQEKTQGVVI